MNSSISKLTHSYCNHPKFITPPNFHHPVLINLASCCLLYPISDITPLSTPSNNDIIPLSTLSESYSIGFPLIDQLQVHNIFFYGLQYLFLIQFELLSKILIYIDHLIRCKKTQVYNEKH
jgi:hypothetical protein